MILVLEILESFLLGLSGSNLNGPSGIEMTDNGDGTWELTTELESGDYTYKFRNGYYDYWDGPGWEGDNGLIDGGCAVGEYFDRLVSVGDSDIVVYSKLATQIRYIKKLKSC